MNDHLNSRLSHVAIILALSLIPAGCSSTGFQGSSSKTQNPPPKEKSQVVEPAVDNSDDAETPQSKTKTDTASAKNSDIKPTGDAGPKNSTQNADKISGASNPDINTDPIPAKCDASGITRAALLTPSVANSTVNNSIDYEIAIADCKGTLKVFSAQSIQFDFDASFGQLGSGFTFPYTITSGADTITGVLTEVAGTDLFGNTGPTYYHYQTDKQVTTSTTSQTVRISIGLRGVTVTSKIPVIPVPKEFTVKTYLRFGTAAPVAKDVTFRN